MANALRTRLSEEALLGTFVKLPRPEVVDVVALAGFDFFVLDLEHGQSSYAEARETLGAARAAGVDAVVRIGVLDTALANRLLEAGAAGIQLSTVTSVTLARGLRAALRYQPLGERSISLAQPAARYGATALSDYLAEFGEHPLVVGQFETVRYDDPIADIASHLDIAFIGPTDLSVAAGTPGSLDEGAAAEVIAQVESAAHSGAQLGTFVASPTAARDAFARGYRYVLLASDLAVLGSALRDGVAEVRA
ncbi:HpcH/HpaI aldolase/citrate lyase family protein [Microbacterium sp. NPDC091313]